MCAVVFDTNNKHLVRQRERGREEKQGTEQKKLVLIHIIRILINNTLQFFSLLFTIFISDVRV